jgi:hypothetical protein
MKATILKPVLAFSLLSVSLTQVPLQAQALQDPVQPVNIILDSDMSQNADDVGDHAMLWALAARGEADVLALILSSTNDYSAACAQAVANHYGHPSVPIGANKTSIPGAYAAGASYYTLQVSQRFGTAAKRRALFPDAVTVYRQALSTAPDHSVYIVAGGYYRPLRELLESGPDAISPLSGVQLVSQKVRRLIPVSGRFPDSLTGPGNLGVDPDSASYVVANWPTEIVWLPDDQLWDTLTGPASTADPNTNPVKYAYDLYCAVNHCSSQTPAWAQGGLLHAIRGGIGVNFSVGGQNGSTVVWDSTTSAPGRSIWSQAPDRQHAYILKAISSVQMSAILNPLVQWIPPQGGITQPPIAASQSVTTPGAAV